MSKNQSPYMLETASNYLRAATFLWGEPNLSQVAVVNAVIGIEIILKSFSATPSDNDRKSTAREQYEINGTRLHKLTELAGKIDSATYEHLGFHCHDCWFKQYDNLFIEARYPYEPSSRAGYSDEPIKIGIQMLRATIDWYKKTGNTDPWVTLYPSVRGGNL